MPQNLRSADVQRVSPQESTTECVQMTLDEYEAIRLLDLENLQQEQAAAQMGVARTTVQLIYNNARRKLADCLVNGKRLVIEGGDVALCERHAQCPDADIAAAAAARNIKK